METAASIDIPRSQFGSEDHLIDSPNLRDLLRIKEDNSVNHGGRTNPADLTSSFSLNNAKRGGNLERIQSSRTLRRQGSGSNWTSSVPVPASDVPIHPQNSFRNITRWDSTRISTPASDGSDHPESEAGGVPRSRSVMLQRNASRAIERPTVRFEGFGDEPEEEETTEEGLRQTREEAASGPEDGGGGGGGGGGGEEAPVRMSLMSLLAETDKQMGIDGSLFAMEEDDEEEEEEGGGEYNNCCVCMVRHKGEAFIPCGHTFCRLCSRELLVQRRSCPLCNNFILEILDIF